MGTATQWQGFGSGILQAVYDALAEQQEALGLKTLRIGEEARGWAYPACFIYLAPGGVNRKVASGRTATAQFTVPVRLLVIAKDATRSLDIEVLAILENVLDVLDAAQPLGGSSHHDMPRALEVAPIARGARGDYETAGVADVEFYKNMERAHA
jgi:hypothetical protein